MGLPACFSVFHTTLQMQAEPCRHSADGCNYVGLVQKITMRNMRQGQLQVLRDVLELCERLCRALGARRECGIQALVQVVLN